MGLHFTFITDCTALQAIVNKSDLLRIIARWVVHMRIHDLCQEAETNLLVTGEGGGRISRPNLQSIGYSANMIFQGSKAPRRFGASCIRPRGCYNSNISITLLHRPGARIRHVEALSRQVMHSIFAFDLYTVRKWTV